jgi:hypothetical protein
VSFIDSIVCRLRSETSLWLQGRCEGRRADPAMAPWPVLEAGSAALASARKLRGLRVGGVGDSVAEQAYQAKDAAMDSGNNPVTNLPSIFALCKQRAFLQVTRVVHRAMCLLALLCC